MKKIYFILLLLFPLLHANGLSMIKNINEATQDSTIVPLVEMNGDMYFIAVDGVSGSELWISDGTDLGTTMLKDICAGEEGSFAATSFAVMGSTLYFTADDCINGKEVWKTDGTSSGTVMLRDINRNSGVGSNPRSLVVYNGLLYFSANDGVEGQEIWTSDGTELNTQFTYGINPGQSSSNISNMIELNSKLYFSADDGTHGKEPWYLDATGPHMIFDVNTGATSSSPGSFNMINSDLYYTATTPSTGRELWISETLSSARIVKDIYIGSDSSDLRYLTVVNNTLYFRAEDSSFNAKLWKSDGTQNGTVVVKDIKIGSGGSNPDNLIGIGTMLYFTANDGTSNNLYKSDGSSGGTISLSYNNPDDLVFLNNKLYFNASSNFGSELMSYSIASGLVTLEHDIRPGEASGNPSRLTQLGLNLYFEADDVLTGRELWKCTNGSSCSMVKDINTQDASSQIGDKNYVGDTLYFSAFDEIHGRELWKSDGTSEGTVLVKDIYPGLNDGYGGYSISIGDTLYFTASSTTSSTNSELWKSDGTSVGTVMIKGGNSYPQDMVSMNNILYFTANDSTNGRELWKSDGTINGTTLVKDIFTGTENADISDIDILGSTLYFFANDGSSHGKELWKSDGTTAGTMLVKDIYTGSEPSVDYIEDGDFIGIGNTYYFYADDGVHGFELWKSDGSEAGTIMVKDINPGSYKSSEDGSDVKMVTLRGNSIYFVADDGVHGFELWKSDGTLNGTSMLKDMSLNINSSNGADYASDIIAIDKVLYLLGKDGNGSGLYSSDGTEVGSSIIYRSSSIRDFTILGSSLYFSSNNMLMKSDGTTEGTIEVYTDTYPLHNFTAACPTLYLPKDSTVYNNALWKYETDEVCTKSSNIVPIINYLLF